MRLSPYYPTWYLYHLGLSYHLTGQYEKAIETLLAYRSDVNVVLLGHEKFWRDARDGSNPRAAGVAQEIQALAEREARLKFFPCAADQAPYLALADVFVCDNSSAFVECLLFDRPILFFDHPEFEFVDENVGEAYRSAGEKFSDCQQLAGGLRGALSGPDTGAQDRERALQYLLSRRGCATDFLVDLIVRLGRVSGPQSLRWRRACEVIDQVNAELADASEKAG